MEKVYQRGLRKLRLMRTALMACLLIVSVTCEACGQRLRVNTSASYASETIDVRVGQDQVESVAAGLRREMAPAGGGYGSIIVSTQPDYRTQTIQAETDVYVSALEDARRKAQAIAERERTALGPVESIQEVLSGATPPMPATLGLKGNAFTAPGIRVSPNQPVILFVAYKFGAPTQDLSMPHVIAVYGLASPQSRQYGGPGVPSIIEITLSISGKTPAAALDALSQTDKLARDILAKMNVPRSAVTVIRSSFNG